ncbi:major capsid protein [Metabacillus sp. Hm71]|uniref:major capsid protein n=1 Tax=Metabacillus sp. Hm71 TaxID=3450743 RepID=UPI003F426298
MAGLAHLKEFQKESLRGLIDESVKQSEPTLADKYLPNAETYSRNFAFDLIKKNKNIAPMIAFGAEAPIVDRDAVAKISGQIAKMGLKYVATEEELLEIFEARSNESRADAVDRLVTKGLDLVEAIQKRIELMKMEAITKGSLTHNGNGVKVNVDFGIPAEHKIALTSPNDWDDIAHDVIGDLLQWQGTYESTNGKLPDDILVSREVVSRMQKNTAIIAEAGRPDGTLRCSLKDVNEVLDSYGLPQLTVVNSRKITVYNLETGQDQVIEFMPENRLIMISVGVGEFLLGPTVENDFKPGIAAKAYDKDEPEESVIKAVAAGFPAFSNPSLVLHADVFTA